MDAPLVAGPETVQRAAAARRRRPVWLTGSFVLGLILLFWPLVAALTIGLVVDPRGLRIGAAPVGSAPSALHPFGSDNAGRDLLTLLAVGTPPTYVIGFVAGFLATAFGTIIGLISGYARGATDTVLRGIIDVTLGIPALAVAIIVTALLGSISTEQLALVIAVLIWAFPARQIRSQVLSLREQQYVFISRLSNQGSLSIVFTELLPNLLPFVMASLVASISFAILLAVGLQLLSLGSAEPTLGLVLQLAISGGALSRGMWWWWLPPAIVLVSIFIGLFLLSTSVDRLSNPRLREVADAG
ncbi:MAG TPA: ABC transporter permease [Candidatus Limnocylindrales bacterium]